MQELDQRHELVDDLRNKGAEQASEAVRERFPPSQKDITDLNRLREEDDYGLSKTVVNVKRHIYWMAGYTAIFLIVLATLFVSFLLLNYGVYLLDNPDKVIALIKDIWKIASGAFATIAIQHFIWKARARGSS
ncbi:hypothetical protein [Microbulbifer sp. TYP-18]|uniref:hypothetical protein n=1 Tax=Microbulbifer sp. TYP-18 TaxID=3230024 RepID=UPI0034C64F17